MSKLKHSLALCNFYQNSIKMVHNNSILYLIESIKDNYGRKNLAIAVVGDFKYLESTSIIFIKTY